MNKKLEINIDFLAYFKSNDKIKAEDFKKSKTVFNIFDKNEYGELDSKEINNAFKHPIKHSKKNKQLRRNLWVLT